MSNLARELEHLKHHVSYPADKKGIVAACNNMMDVPADDRDWFSKTLPEGRYKGPEDVMKAIFIRI